MKTKIIISVVALSLVLITKSAFAKSEIITGTPKTVRNQIREEVKQEKQEVREEKKNTISELKLKKVEAIYKGIKMGLEKRHTALLKIKAKLDARIAKNPMKRDQKSIDAIKLKLDTDFAAAEAKYQADMKTLDVKFETLKTSTKTSEAIKGLKDTVNLIREDLNSIKKVLTSAVTALAKAPKIEVAKTE